MFDFIGKLHLLLLHLPIGLLGFAFLLELLARVQHKPELKEAAKYALAFGIPAAVLAAGTGWLLSQQGGYDADLLQKHQWLGFATAAFSIACWLMRGSDWYFVSLAILSGTLAFAGHYGGALTHGEGYLFAPAKQALKEDSKTAYGKPDSQVVVYQAFIQPIIEQKCISCHNPNKKKGGLLMDSPDHILLGGEDGPVLVAGKPDESPILQRPLLPLHHDDHMPPAGKPQLTDREITLLRWWIEQGADPQKKFGQMKLTPEIEKLFQAPAHTENPVYALNIPKADASTIERLRARGIAVMPLGREGSLLSVSLTGNHKLSADLLSGLKDIAPQITQLDLANTNADDRMCNILDALPNLSRLNLAHTAITDATVKSLAKMQYLDYLNLVNTKVTDACLSDLKGLKNLRSLYVWQTGIQAPSLSQLTSQLPGLKVDSGDMNDTSTVPLPLRAPKVLFARNIFEDTVQVSFDFPKMVDVHYAFNEASPTTQSPKYEGNPIVLKESTKVRALAVKPGWANSSIVEASFVKRKYRIQNAVLAAPPSPKYPGNGASSLIDGKISDNYLDNAFIGYEGEHVDAVLDLGTTIDFTRLSAHCVENNGSWVFLPHGLHVWTSDDGKKWQPCINAQYPVNASMQDARASLISETAPTPVKCRYLKVRVESQLKNPKWHPGAGQKCWVFVDELLVE